MAVLTDRGGSSTCLIDLPDDILSIVGKSLSPRDICSLSLCCRNLNVAAASDKIWLTQCEMLGVVSGRDIADWRKAVLSYKALYRFITSVKPLLGMWVHKNPELGNVVYVMPGFVSVVGCRIIPQHVGPLGIEDGPLLWAPVFEILGDEHGATAFILHGRDRGEDYIYPGSFKSVEKSCNVLLLEVEPKNERNIDNFLHTDEDDSQRAHSQSITDRQSSVAAPFQKLSSEDMEKLLEIVTTQVHVPVSDTDSTGSPLFPCLRGDEEKLSERRTMLIKIHKLGVNCVDWTPHIELPIPSNQDDLSDEETHDRLEEFLSSGDKIGLTLQATTEILSWYYAWPMIGGTQFALCKLPIPEPTVGEEYAGLWGGTFGWPPVKTAEENKPEKALFFVLLSYSEESPGQKFLVATKILEGSHYVNHPNGSAMFIVNVDSSSDEEFPWSSNAESGPVVVSRAFSGEGITGGYGFRYPGSKPGSLFILEDRMLAFVWKSSSSVLTLHRINNLEKLLKKGKRVPAVSPIDNFSYMNIAYTNVYTQNT